ncbi:MAG TPA: hypothetical protein VF598_01740 [Hymenobacter sp.]|jgi:hypothetical protein
MGVEVIVSIIVAAGGLLVALWRNSAQKKSLDDNTRDTAKIEARVDIHTLNILELKLQAKQTDKSLGEIKEAQHKTNGKLQSMDNHLLLIKDWVDEQKRGDK